MPARRRLLAELLCAHHRGQAAADVRETLGPSGFLLARSSTLIRSQFSTTCSEEIGVRVGVNVGMPPDEFRCGRFA